MTENTKDPLKQLGERERVLRRELNSTITREQRMTFINELRQIIDARRVIYTKLDIRKVTFN